MNSKTMPEDTKFTYRNASKNIQTLMGVGQVLPGQTVEVDHEVENPNFVKVDTRRFVNVEAPVEQPDVNTVKGVEKPTKAKK